MYKLFTYDRIIGLIKWFGGRAEHMPYMEAPKFNPIVSKQTKNHQQISSYSKP